MNPPLFRAPILIVEDDRDTSDMVAVYLQRKGFNTVAAHAGHEALDLASQHDPILTILDVMLPDLDGWEICRRLRGFSIVPILMLSALGEPQHRVKGLSLGADDYLVKPFCLEELVARVNAILRRVTTEPSQNPLLTHGGLTIDRVKRRVFLNGRDVFLTPSEFRLLQTLMAAPGRVFLREELVRYLYPLSGVVVDRVIDVHIGKVRQKIEQDPSSPRYVLTARGLGYQFADR